MTGFQFNVVIIGAGAIGAFVDTPESEYVLTHAHAFSAHSGFKLLGFVDTNMERSQNAARLWKCNAYRSIQEAIASDRVDIACVAVPDELHYVILKEISALPLKAVFTEKPLTKTVREAEEVVAIYGNRKIPVCVNYKRGFVPEFEELRDRIKSDAFGKYVTGTGYYGKGLLHNGSHLIHLLYFLIGDVTEHMLVASENDYYSDDPSISATLTLENKKRFSLHHINCGHFTIFEVDLIFEGGRIRITDTGFNIEYHAMGDHDILKGYRVLAKSKEVKTTMGKSLYYSASNIHNHLALAEPMKCSLYDALAIMRICEKIRSSMRTCTEG
jgi:predicted dehydrogenase